MTYRGLADALGVVPERLKALKYKSADYPQSDTSHKYDVAEVCRWILRNLSKGSKLRRNAAALLSSLGVEPPGRKAAASTPAPRAAVSPSANAPVGFADNLQAFREAVQDCHRRYLDAVRDGEEMLIQQALRTWGVSMETLRKAETSVLDIEKERGRLVPLATAKEFQVSVWTAVKQKLLTLGARLAPTLVNVSSQKIIQDALDTEARQILDDAKRRLE